MNEPRPEQERVGAAWLLRAARPGDRDHVGTKRVPAPPDTGRRGRRGARPDASGRAGFALWRQRAQAERLEARIGCS